MYETLVQKQKVPWKGTAQGAYLPYMLMRVAQREGRAASQVSITFTLLNVPSSQRPFPKVESN